MDREIAYAIIAAVAGIAIIGSFMLGPQAPSPASHASYELEDVRYKLHQSETKKKKKKAPAPEQMAPQGTTSSGGGDTASDEPQEEPPLDEGDAEAPPLE